MKKMMMGLCTIGCFCFCNVVFPMKDKAKQTESKEVVAKIESSQTEDSQKLDKIKVKLSFPQLSSLLDAIYNKKSSASKKDSSEENSGEEEEIKDLEELLSDVDGKSLLSSFRKINNFLLGIIKDGILKSNTNVQFVEISGTQMQYLLEESLTGYNPFKRQSAAEKCIKSKMKEIEEILRKACNKNPEILKKFDNKKGSVPAGALV